MREGCSILQSCYLEVIHSGWLWLFLSCTVKNEGKTSSEQIKTFSSVQHASAGDRSIWIKRREAFLGELTQRFNNYLLYSVS